MAKIDPYDKRAWVLAVDLKNKRLHDVGVFRADRSHGVTLSYIHSRISHISRPNKVIIMIRLCMIAFLKVVGLFKIKSVWFVSRWWTDPWWYECNAISQYIVIINRYVGVLGQENPSCLVWSYFRQNKGCIAFFFLRSFEVK